MSDEWQGKIGRSPGLDEDGEPKYYPQPLDDQWATDVLESLQAEVARLEPDEAVAGRIAAVIRQLMSSGWLVAAPTLEWYGEELDANLRAVRDQDGLFQKQGIGLGLRIARAALQAVLEGDRASYEGLAEKPPEDDQSN